MKIYIVEWYSERLKKWIPVGGASLKLQEAKYDIYEWRRHDNDKYRIARYERVEK